MNLSYKYRGNGFYVLNGYSVESFYEYRTAKLGYPAIPLKLFADYKVSLKHEEIYGGFSAGYVMKSQNINLSNAELLQYISSIYGNGYTIGIQLGGTYFLNQRIGLNAELQGNYMSFLNGSNRLFEFPATLGIRYRIGKIVHKITP